MMKSIKNILSLLLLALIFTIAGTAFWYRLPFSDLLKTVILIGWVLFYIFVEDGTINLLRGAADPSTDAGSGNMRAKTEGNVAIVATSVTYKL